MHEFDRGVTKYDIMPIPPVEAHCERFRAGPIEVWVEYRLLDDAIAAAHQANEGFDGVVEQIDDRGVSLHVFGEPSPGAAPIEYLRFDCFEEDPHYHYVDFAQSTNEMVHLESVALGDPLEWALERIRIRLPQMLRRAGGASVAERIDAAAIEAVLPRVAEAAYRARFRDKDETAMHEGALAEATPVDRASTAAR